MTITAQLAEPASLIFAQVLDLDWEGWQTEQRDWHGRWARTGSAEVARAEEWARASAGKINPRELDEYNTREYERTTLDPAYHYTDAQKEAVGLYTEHSFEINSEARGEPPEHSLIGQDKVRDATAAMDSAMQPLPQDVTLLREVAGASALSHLGRGDILADDAFSSTTLRPGRYAGGRGDTTIMHIVAPKGTPAIWTGAISGYKEDEVILPRGQPMAILRSAPQSGRTDVTHVWLVAMPKEAVG